MKTKKRAKMKNWIDVYCKFCGVPLECTIFPPSCTCEGYAQARSDWLEDVKNEPDYEAPLSEEDFNKKYPIVFSSERTLTYLRG